MGRQNYCSVDAEGDVGSKGLEGVAVFSAETQEYLRGADDIRSELRRQAELGAVFLAHNAQYDLGVIFWQLGLPMRAHGNNGQFTHGTWKFDKHRPAAELWDTYELSGRLSLKDLGQSIGVPKYPTPQRLLGHDPDRYAWRCEAHDKGECEECYAIRDAEIVYRFMIGWEATLRGWGCGATRRLGASSVQVWQALDTPRPSPLMPPKARSLGRDAYHGGRVEPYMLGTIGPLWTADVRSMFASCMVDTPMPEPTRLVYVTDAKPEGVRWDYEGVVEVDVMVPAMHVPPLPYLHRNRLTYPVGRFRTCCTLHELRYATSLGCVVEKVHRLAFSTGIVWPFEHTVGAWWALKESYEKAGDPRALHAKLLLNNLYGMFGVRESRDKRTSQLWTDKHNPSPREWDNWTIVGSQVVAQKDREQRFQNPAANVLWAAQITGAARVKLHRLQVLQGANLVYSDTDSIFSTAPILGLSEGLGGLKETGVFEQAVIAGPKMYALLRYERDMPEEWATEPCAPHKARRCQECRWHARCGGTKRDVALSFLRQGYATWREPVGPLQAAKRGVPAGTWIEVYRERHTMDPRRHILNPSVITTGAGWSETAPPVEGAVQWPTSLNGR